MKHKTPLQFAAEEVFLLFLFSAIFMVLALSTTLKREDAVFYGPIIGAVFYFLSAALRLTWVFIKWAAGKILGSWS
ncbi:MAG TPA: hypothetical protein PKZ41_03665 [Candidatus Omnitrophota bacterium]|nr:hypothetical protein [Candidatus Omnitrophota bacterium]